MVNRKISNYFGGKNGNGTYHFIINHIPVHQKYLEPFGGSFAIFRNKLTAVINILNDKDRQAILNIKNFVSTGLINNKLDAGGKSVIKEINDTLVPEIIYKNIDGRVLIKDFIDDGNTTFIYIDPPYLFESRKSNKKRYNFEMNVSEHEELLKLIIQCKCNVMISAYKNNLYDKYLKDWQRLDFSSQTRKGKRIESIYINYEVPVILHDFRYIGADFREREQIKISTNNVLKKFERMNILKRQSILSALFQKYKLSIPIKEIDDDFESYKNTYLM